MASVLKEEAVYESSENYINESNIGFNIYFLSL